MSEPGREELLHAELDGTASAADSARLRSLLEEEPELAARLEALRRASGELERAERLEPPPELLEGVMAAVRERSRAEAVRPGWLEALRGLLAPVPLAACAAALLVGVVLGVLLPAGFGASPAERESLSGTALPHGRLGESADARSVAFRTGEVSGEATARRAGELLVVEVRLDARQPVEVRLVLDGAEVRPRSFERVGSGEADVVMRRGEVRIAHPGGAGRYRIGLELGPRSAGAVRLFLGDREGGALPFGRMGR